MTSIIRKIILATCMLGITAGLIGCTGLNSYDNEDKVPDEDGTNIEDNTDEGNNDDESTDDNNTMNEPYSEELAQYFPAQEGMAFNYSGTVEYGQLLTVDQVTKEDHQLALSFMGEIEDVSGGEGLSKEERSLEVSYVITHDAVKEIVKNETIRFSQSNMKEHVVLKTPIEEGNKWTQKVTIDNKSYDAETTITEVSNDEKGKSMVKTETKIADMADYPDETYKEIRTYKEGKGLSEFHKVILLNVEEGDITPFEFGYTLFEAE
ncbi:hypothetical protein HZI73_00310 [Vallitalea pronyensis]|uniref:Uncharacterized protein n=1 Tax=Vallitalea pronyensis TaxID=1348613 RepID=A0A8J8MFW7_9FIRM|nr:hypothetical protein [Vallitalea pronyensis]QUI20844.1 hypothetical protein HZI73_00310 [Vallitalea pronyensis]